MTVNEQGITTKQNQSLHCPVCGDPLSFQMARGRKSGKVFLMVKCLHDGRHFRGFINHRPFVEGVIQNLEGLTKGKN
jgi:predicted RNA-binding Zn-ribbon protein involved in translation (DUF1610 family)